VRPWGRQNVEQHHIGQQAAELRGIEMGAGRQAAFAALGLPELIEFQQRGVMRTIDRPNVACRSDQMRTVGHPKRLAPAFPGRVPYPVPESGGGD